VISSLVLLLGNIAWMIDPFMPQTAEKILIMLNLAGQPSPEATAWQGRKIKFSEYPSLFPRIEK
jgi:methionyl-tRNA synthetase